MLKVRWYTGWKGNTISRLPSNKILVPSKELDEKPEPGEEWVILEKIELPFCAILTKGRRFERPSFPTFSEDGKAEWEIVSGSKVVGKDSGMVESIEFSSTNPGLVSIKVKGVTFRGHLYLSSSGWYIGKEQENLSLLPRIYHNMIDRDKICKDCLTEAKDSPQPKRVFPKLLPPDNPERCYRHHG